MDGEEDPLLASIHASRTINSGPWNHIKAVRLQRVGDLKHWVFRIPVDKLQSNAVSFGDFCSNVVASSYRRCFTFFLDYVNHALGSKPPPKKRPRRGGDAGDGDADDDVGDESDDDCDEAFSNTVSFLEWASGEHGNCVGYRVHVFSTKYVDERKSLRSFLRKNAEFCRKAKHHKKKQEMLSDKFRRHMEITDKNSYVQNICDVYLQNNSSSERMDQPMDEFLPLGMFNIGNMFFHDELVDGRSVQEFDYEDNSCFCFPVEDNIIRIDCNLLNLEQLPRKYLPDYFMYRVCQPRMYYRHVEDFDGHDVQLTFDTRHPMFVLPRLFEALNNGENMDVDDSDIRQMQENVFTVTKEFFVDSVFSTVIDEGFTVLETPSETISHDSFGFMTYESKITVGHISKESFMVNAHSSDIPIHDEKLISQASLSDIDMLEILHRKLMRTIGDREKVDDFVINEFEKRVWMNPECKISKCGQNIIKWFQKDRKFTHFSSTLRHRDMSVFADLVIKGMQWNDVVFSMSSTHKLATLCRFGKYDSYTHEPDRMHFHIALTGEEATSKSFVFGWTVLTSVPGTTKELTYETLRAFAADADNNWFRRIYNEAPPGMTAKNNKNNPEQEAQFKERLTSNRASCERLWTDPDTGVRKTITTVSQCISVYFLAMNDPKTSCSKALQSRFYWPPMCDNHLVRPGQSVSECMRADISMSGDRLKYKDYVIQFLREEDARMFAVKQLQYIGVLNAVEMEGAEEVIDIFREVLKKKKISMPTRALERIRILADKLTICKVLHEMFNIPAPVDDQGYMKNHYDEPFNVKMLLDINPYLTCTYEIVIFAFGLLWNEIVPVEEKKVLKTVWKIHNMSRTYKKMPDSPDLDYNFISIKARSYKQLADRIRDNMSDLEGKMGAVNILSTLREMSQKIVRTRDYKMEDINAGQNTGEHVPGWIEEDGLQANQPMSFPVIDTTTAKSDRSKVMLDPNSAVYFSTALFEKFKDNATIDDEDLYRQCVEATRHKYLRRRKILLGRVMRKGLVIQYPHLFETMDVAPDASCIHMISKGIPICDSVAINLQFDEGSENLVMDADFDTYAAAKKSMSINIDILAAGCDPGTVEDDYMTASEKYMNINYPDDYIAEIKRSKTKRRLPVSEENNHEGFLARLRKRQRQ